MDSITITLPIPGRELSPNGTTYWAIKIRHKKASRLMAQVTMHNAMIQVGWRKPPKWKNAVVSAVVIRKDRRGRMDDDNIKASCKHAMDGVCDSGLIENDRGLRWGDVTWTVDKTVEPCMRLTFERVADA
jgi:hypothetical protein